MTTTEAIIGVGDYRQHHNTTFTPGKLGERIEITAGEQQYRITVGEDGSLKIMSESFTHSQLAVFPSVTNVITIKGV